MSGDRQVRFQVTAWNGDAASAAARAGAERGLRLAAEHVLGESRKEVPVQDGILMASGRAEVSGLTAAVSYNTVYARRQHEELGWRHDRGKAKYLEEPLLRAGPVAQQMISQAIRSALGQ